MKLKFLLDYSYCAYTQKLKFKNVQILCARDIGEALILQLYIVMPNIIYMVTMQI